MAVKIDLEKCTGCGDCVSSCPSEAIEIKDEKAVVNDNCIDCSVCISECSVEAISE